MIDKKYLFLESMIRFTEIFGNENIGNCEVDMAHVIEFAETQQFQLMMSWDCHTLDDYYKLIEDIVLDGFPIWNFLKISDWTKEMMKREFTKILQEQKELEQIERNKYKYKCYSCRYFKEIKTSLGTIEECRRPKENGSRLFAEANREPFKPKKRCKHFKIKESKVK